MGQQLNYWSELKRIKGSENKMKGQKKAKVQIIKPEVK
jgi:hypothetical protein